MQEEAVVNAFTADLYVTTLGNLSLRGSVTSGFDGDHELVLGGYSQVIPASNPEHTACCEVGTP